MGGYDPVREASQPLPSPGLPSVGSSSSLHSNTSAHHHAASSSSSSSSDLHDEYGNRSSRRPSRSASIVDLLNPTSASSGGGGGGGGKDQSTPRDYDRERDRPSSSTSSGSSVHRFGEQPQPQPHSHHFTHQSSPHAQHNYPPPSLPHSHSNPHPHHHHQRHHPHRASPPHPQYYAQPAPHLPPTNGNGHAAAPSPAAAAAAPLGFDGHPSRRASAEAVRMASASPHGTHAVPPPPHHHHAPNLARQLSGSYHATRTERSPSLHMVATTVPSPVSASAVPLAYARPGSSGDSAYPSSRPSSGQYYGEFAPPSRSPRIAESAERERGPYPPSDASSHPAAAIDSQPRSRRHSQRADHSAHASASSSPHHGPHYAAQHYPASPLDMPPQAYTSGGHYLPAHSYVATDSPRSVSSGALPSSSPHLNHVPPPRSADGFRIPSLPSHRSPENRRIPLPMATPASPPVQYTYHQPHDAPPPATPTMVSTAQPLSASGHPVPGGAEYFRQPGMPSTPGGREIMPPLTPGMPPTPGGSSSVDGGGYGWPSTPASASTVPAAHTRRTSHKDARPSNGSLVGSPHPVEAPLPPRRMPSSDMAVQSSSTQSPRAASVTSSSSPQHPQRRPSAEGRMSIDSLAPRAASSNSPSVDSARPSVPLGRNRSESTYSQDASGSARAESVVASPEVAKRQNGDGARESVVRPADSGRRASSPHPISPADEPMADVAAKSSTPSEPPTPSASQQQQQQQQQKSSEAAPTTSSDRKPKRRSSTKDSAASIEPQKLESRKASPESASVPAKEDATPAPIPKPSLQASQSPALLPATPRSNSVASVSAPVPTSSGKVKVLDQEEADRLAARDSKKRKSISVAKESTAASTAPPRKVAKAEHLPASLPKKPLVAETTLGAEGNGSASPRPASQDPSGRRPPSLPRKPDVLPYRPVDRVSAPGSVRRPLSRTDLIQLHEVIQARGANRLRQSWIEREKQAGRDGRDGFWEKVVGTWGSQASSTASSGSGSGGSGGGGTNVAGRDRRIQESEVARHYNNRREVGLSAREFSPILPLKSFNNWVKSVLIGLFGERRGKVMDMGGGKGGDLQKWDKLGVRELVLADIAATSVEQAEKRYKERNFRWPASFYALDCFSQSLAEALPASALDPPFDTVSLQFCMHYGWSSLQNARLVIENVSRYLRTGGFFIGTIPNDEELLRRRDRLPQGELEFGNSKYHVRFEQREKHKPFGDKYTFFLDDAVDEVPEYVVDWTQFQSLANEYGLELAFKKPMAEVWEEFRGHHEFGSLARRMKVCAEPRYTEQPMEQDLWEATTVYLAFAFRKYR